MVDSSVSAGVVRRVFEFAVTCGVAREKLHAASLISPGDLADFDGRVPLSRYLALLRVATELSGDRAFCLHYGDCVNLAEASVVGLIGYSFATLLEAFVQLARYSRLIANVDCGREERFTLATDEIGLWLIDNRRASGEAPELTEIAFAQKVNGTRRFGETSFVQEVRVTYPDRGIRTEYERVLGASVSFDSDRNAMRIDPDWLTRRVAQQPAYVFGILTRHADCLMSELDSKTTTRGQVEALLMTVLHRGETRKSEAARALGWSRDTLYRRLRSEGITFAQVLDDLRHRVALEYVAGRQISLNEAAYLVGFSDPAAFSRAFKRWTGHRPSHVRNKRAEPGPKTLA